MPQAAEVIAHTNAPAIESQGRDLEFGRICTSICDLAAGVFETPMVLIKLYEGNELVLRGTHGFTSAAMLDDLSFCQRKLIPGESLVIADATADARYFLESAVLNGPKIRFYADIPLVSDGVVLGVLALCERTARHDFGTKINLFRQFANNAATTIALAQSTLERNELASEIKSQQSRFDLAQEMTGIGYWSIDLKTREITWSKGLYAVYGISPKSYKPRVATQLDIYEQEDQAIIIDRFQRAVNQGEDFDFTVNIVRRKDKVTRTVRTKGGVELGDDGKPARLCACVRDITEGANDAEELVRARMAADEADSAKTAFLEQITNELKTPLNNILGYARLINEHRHDNPDIASYTQNLMKSAKALQSMVKDTIETTALETAPSVREATHAHTTEESVNVVNFVKDLVNQFSPLAQANQTRLNAHFVDFDNSWAQMDVMRVRQVVQNLMSNAVKFTKGGLINVTASQVMVDNGTWLRISVRDTGIGMSEEQSHGLFGGNIQDLNGNRVSGGGIGLSIAKAIVDLLGGHIGVVSRVGEGSNFWFEIPVNWVDAPARSRMGDVAPAPLARSVNRVPGADTMRPAATVQRPPVDEDRINREYLRALLEDMKLDIG